MSELVKVADLRAAMHDLWGSRGLSMLNDALGVTGRLDPASDVVVLRALTADEVAEAWARTSITMTDAAWVDRSFRAQGVVLARMEPAEQDSSVNPATDLLIDAALRMADENRDGDTPDSWAVRNLVRAADEYQRNDLIKEMGKK